MAHSVHPLLFPYLPAAGMGVYGGGSFAERGSSDDDSDGGGGDDSGSDSSFNSRSRGPWPVAIQRPDARAEEAAAAAPEPAADEEEGGPQPRWWRRACCAGCGLAVGRPAAPGWLKLHLMQLRLMKVSAGGPGGCDWRTWV